MRKLSLFFLLIIANSSMGQSFMGVSIDGSQMSVKANLLNKGFKLVESNSGEFYYKGKLNNENVSILVTATPKTKKVYRFYITYEDDINSWSSILSQFERKNKILIAKYGQPEAEKRDFEYPFKEGDGYELLALETDKLNYLNIWKDVGDNKNLGIVLTITKNKKISMMYLNVINFDLANQEVEAINNDVY